MKYIFLILLLLCPLSIQAFSNNDVVSEINGVRSQYGLQTVASDEELNRIALAKALDMFLKGYWAHSDNGNTWTFFERYGYSYETAGEVIARGYKTEDAMVVGWMASPSHKAALVNPVYHKMGVSTIGGITVVVLVKDWVSPPPVGSFVYVKI